MNHQKQYQINVADIIISVYSMDDNTDLIINKSLEKFIYISKENADIFINVYSHIPDQFKNCKTLFSADKENYLFNNNISPYNWCVCASGTTRFIKIYKEEQINKPEIIACFDKDASHWVIYFEKPNQPVEDYQIDPFMYPLGPLILYYTATFNDGLMIHSAGVFDNNKGYIFSGVSGIGKTTVSKIWNDENALIISDDRLIIRKKSEKYHIYNSPMNYSDDSKMVPLNYIFLLKQSPENYAKKINGTEAIARLMANCIQHNYDEQLINLLLTRCSDIYQSFPLYELGFVPDNSIVQFVRNNEFN